MIQSNNLTKPSVSAIDLFAGPGGLSLGFRKAGFKIVAAVECDPNAITTYEKNFPETELLKEKIENVNPNKLFSVLSKENQKVVLIGGPPCQPFSSANRQTNGSNNPQFSTVDYFATFVEKIMPDAFLFENVVTFRYMNEGKSMESFKKRLDEIGFETDIAILEFDKFGVPQRRKRLFIGGLRKDYSMVFKLSPRMSHKPKITVKDAISDLPALQSGGGGKDEADYPEKKLTSYQAKARAGSHKLYNHWCSKNSEAVVETIKRIKRGSSLKKSWSILPKSVRARYKNPEAIHNNIYRRLSWGEQSPTIVHARRAMLLHPSVNRIITVREAARLQNFPDSYRFHGGIHSQYQQVANAVSPGLAKAIAKVFLTYFKRVKVANSEKGI